jgi:hypothetical protein
MAEKQGDREKELACAKNSTARNSGFFDSKPQTDLHGLQKRGK